MLRKSIIIAAVLIATILFAFFAIFPKKGELSDLAKRVEEKKRELKAREDYLKELQKISYDLQGYQDELAKIKSALPEDPQVLLIYNFLPKAASRSGLVLKNVSHSLGNSESKGLKTVNLDLTLSGRVDGFRNFLFLVEKSARLIEIGSFSFASPEKKEEPASFNLKIKVYFIE